MKQEKKALTIKTLSKGNVWGIQENDIFRMWELAEKDADFKDNVSHYIEILRSAFDIEEIKTDNPSIINNFENRGYKVGPVKKNDNTKIKIAVKKRIIRRVTDLTYENVKYISASQLLEVLDRNFGGGWDSLSQSIKDIIESAFDISTTTLPKDRLHKPGGMYEKKTADGYIVLEITKGTWIEAIFAKEKPVSEKPKIKLDDNLSDNEESEDKMSDEDFLDEDDNDINDKFDEDEDEDVFDEDKLTEESYRTTFDTSEDELNLTADDEANDDDY